MCFLGDLSSIYEKMKDRVMELESETYDINYIVRQKDFEINELTIAVNDLRGKLLVKLRKRKREKNWEKKVREKAREKEGETI